MWGNMGGPTLIIILFIVLLLFGAPKLPALARSLGQSMKILKKEVAPEKSGDSADAEAGENATPRVPGADALTAPAASSGTSDLEAQLAQARAEAEAARAEAEALKARSAETPNDDSKQ